MNTAPHMRTALVTGAGRGIGRAVALRLGATGHNIVVNDTDAAAADDVAAEVTTIGARAAAVACSVADVAGCRYLVEQAEARLGPIDVLVNNAGIASSGQPVHRTDPTELLALIATHALGPFTLCGLVIPGMRERGFGRIVMISSEATSVCPPNGAPYTMAKAALEALALTLAAENASRGITVNVIAPGLVDTRLGELVVQRLAAGKPADGLPTRVLMRNPEDVAAAVAFVSDIEAEHLTGQRLAV